MTFQQLANICPSCGRTNKLEHAACANAWHTQGVRIVLEGQSQQDAPIPERWRSLHHDAIHLEWRDAKTIAMLIEELGRAEAALTQAREALGHIANDGMDARMCMITALAATQPKEMP